MVTSTCCLGINEDLTWSQPIASQCFNEITFLAQKTTPIQPMSHPDSVLLQKAFATVLKDDKDGDGQITWRDFALKYYDRDGDGDIDSDDVHLLKLRNALVKLGKENIDNNFVVSLIKRYGDDVLRAIF